MLEQTSMEELFDRANPELDENDARKVKALIRRILQYDRDLHLRKYCWIHGFARLARLSKGARQIDCSVLCAFLVVPMVREEHFEHGS